MRAPTSTNACDTALSVVIIKVGGSLAHSEHLRTCLQRVAKLFANQAVIIVPGGGVFADQVRSLQQHWHFDDTTAHTMALLAMQQMALFYQSIHPEFKIISHSQDIKQQYCVHKKLLWSPNISELEAAKINPSWDVTSDSLAAWLANTLPTKKLILIKSAPIDPSLSFAELAQRDIIDKSFCTMISNANYPIKIIHVGALH
jgi:aspartokinase-like uncharacterized kinase